MSENILEWSVKPKQKKLNYVLSSHILNENCIFLCWKKNKKKSDPYGHCDKQPQKLDFTKTAKFYFITKTFVIIEWNVKHLF